MIETALIGLEKAINAYIKLDPDCVKKIAAIKGSSLKIVLSDLQQSFYIVATDCGLQLSSKYNKEASATISATLMQFINFYLKGASNAEMFKNKIIVSGNTSVATAFREIFQSIDIDWEEHLSKITGDAIAHHAGNSARNLLSTGKSILNSLKQNVQEYLHFEGELLPTEKQLKQFSSDVNVLRNDVERLEARFHIIKNNRDRS